MPGGRIDALAARVDGIVSAPRLADAVRLRAAVPAAARQSDERGELDWALLEAMTREARGAGDPEALAAAATALGLRGGVLERPATPLVRAALDAFLDASAAGETLTDGEGVMEWPPMGWICGVR